MQPVEIPEFIEFEANFQEEQIRTLRRDVKTFLAETLSKKDDSLAQNFRASRLGVLHPWQDALSIISDDTLDIKDPEAQSKIRNAINSLYEVNGQAIQPQGDTGKEVFEFLDDYHTRTGMTHLSEAVGVDVNASIQGQTDQVERVNDSRSGLSRRIFISGAAAAATTAGIGNYLKNAPKVFPLGEEALALFRHTTSMDDDKVMRPVRQIHAERDTAKLNNMIRDIDTGYDAEFKTHVLGKLYIDALNSNNKELAIAIVKNSKTLPDIKFEYAVQIVNPAEQRHGKKHKNFLQLANEGYKADFDEVPAEGEKPRYKKGDYAIVPRTEWIKELKQANSKNAEIAR